MQSQQSLFADMNPSEPKISRAWAMPNKNTFEIEPIRKLIEKYRSDDLWIDPFSNRSKLANVTNDLNPEFGTDFNLDALEFLRMFDDASVDGVLYDPPYSTRQISECYKNIGVPIGKETTQASFWSNQKKEISRILKPNGICISFCWNSVGVGKKLGMQMEEILLVSHGGWHNDTICTVERKVS